MEKLEIGSLSAVQSKSVSVRRKKGKVGKGELLV